MFREISQTEKDNDFTYMWNLKSKVNKNRNKLMDRIVRQKVARGEKGWGLG